LSKLEMQNNDLLLILGNQLFPLEYLEKTKIKKIFMAEDFGLTTYHKPVSYTHIRAQET